ncbi:hypothetical protein [Desulfovibrio sp.]|uniref:hypothetical protein n=1 Tax=Desulfovibrio sp. TaxID=885 RepID=UPI0023BDAEB8|nr:hypothetical protein [Desulfovibrio sp.]MDE7241021.1 hypothetical protein [Desulfovibrio sp.]
MSYQVRVNALSLGHALRDAALYVGKNEAWEATAHILLILPPKQRKLAVIGCDGNGYYERRLALVQEKGAPKPSFPGKDKAVLLGAQEAALLVKFCKTKSVATLTVNEDGQGYRLSVALPDGSSTSVGCPANLEVPAYDQITTNAAKGEKQGVTPANMCIPVRELGRASKVFPVPVGQTIPMSVAKWKDAGCLAQLKYLSDADDADIRVIFVLSLPEAKAA